MLDYIGKKVGMTHRYDENGNSTALTMIKLYDNIIFDFDDSSASINRVTIAFNKIENKRNLSKSHIGKFNKKNLPIYKKLRESKITKSAKFEVGSTIKISDIISVGDKISVSGITIGKGFAGGMKRWGFGGLEATHVFQYLIDPMDQLDSVKILERYLKVRKWLDIWVLIKSLQGI